MYKEIKEVFQEETFELLAVKIDKEINSQLSTKITGENLYRIQKGDELLGYVFVDKAPSKTAQFDYMVLFDKNLVVKRTKVLVYREEYGGEIGSKRWLRQFEGKKKNENLNDIAAISGATISVNSMTKAVNNLLASLGYLYDNKIIE
ncbi:FMN-binding protein [Zhouia spongiae]|uniref:FMN-binding protein n=1 Tax=Zhouia spongiae TaxID=2202721 RepID=A0ABY3YM05_9FLAO|nr:FMN-binding protein [Zhouia spongiae]UNY98864.1 FMN-binding protein [Zhouia spongiae]